MKKHWIREITDAERRLWRLFTRNDTRLHEEEEDVAALFDVDEYAKSQRDIKPTYIETPLPLTEDIKKQFTPLKAGIYAGVDRRSAQRLRRGKLPIDRTIDLHGYNQMDAFEQLYLGLSKSAEAGHRVLLVVTGKGNRGEGVIRQNLPLWLNAPSIRPFILAFDQATAKDGGSGAYYVLLKRQR